MIKLIRDGDWIRSRNKRLKGEHVAKLYGILFEIWMC